MSASAAWIYNAVKLEPELEAVELFLNGVVNGCFIRSLESFSKNGGIGIQGEYGFIMPDPKDVWNDVPEGKVNVYFGPYECTITQAQFLACFEVAAEVFVQARPDQERRARDLIAQARSAIAD